MESIEAFGVAAGVLQFVNFATTLVATANDIRNSAEGLGPHNTHLADVTNRLHFLVSKIQNSEGSEGSAASAPSEEMKIMKDLCRGCLDLSQELSHRLEKLRANGASMSRFRSYRMALEAVWDKSTIESLFQRLTMFRGEIDTFLLAAMQ